MSFAPLPVPVIPANDQLKEAKLSEAQERKRVDVLAHFDKPDYKLPKEDNGALLDEEKMWLSNECLLRYLRAAKWDVRHAIIRLEDTLRWRRGYGFYNGTLAAEKVEPEAITGKEILFGYDYKGRPGFYMIPSRQNTDEEEHQLQFAVWMLERAIDLMGPGVESLDLLINFGDKAKNPSIGTARKMLHIIQAHYPERLGLALIINVPFLVSAFFKIVLPLVDPVTREKIKFNPKVFDDGIFERSQVMKTWWGGDAEFEYEHGRYWPVLVKMCEERQEHMKRKWEEIGKKIGTSEWEMKSGWTQEVPAPPLDTMPSEAEGASTEE